MTYFLLPVTDENSDSESETEERSKGTRVLQFLTSLESINHPAAPFPSSPPAPGVHPVPPEQAGQSSGLPLQQLTGAGAPPAPAL